MYTISCLTMYTIAGVLCTAWLYLSGLIDYKRISTKWRYARTVVFAPMTVIWALTESISEKFDQMD